MSKKIRPGRVIADPRSNAIIVEYTVETLGDKNGHIKILSEMKQVVIHTPKIEGDTDIAKIGYRVMKKCKYIPEKWIDKVQDALREIQLRNLDTTSDDSNDNGEVNGERISNILESNLELLYGNEDDKISGLLNILSLCRDPSNLEIILDDHPLMSALSRILSDQGSYSNKIVFNVVKMFLTFADYVDFHPTVSKYRIGASIMKTIDLEIRRTDQIEKDTIDGSKRWQRKGLNKNDNILFFCFQILVRISDNMEILRKMLKKDLAQMLLKTLRSNSKRCLDSILLLLIRATLFDEVVQEILIYQTLQSQIPPIQQFIRLLSATDENISKNALRVLFNLSFNQAALSQMSEGNIVPSLGLRTFRSMRNFVFGILYHLSSFEMIRRSIIFEPLMPLITQSVSSLSNEHTGKEFIGFLINMSLNPFFAEKMMPFVGRLIGTVQKNHDTLVTKVLRNLSVWTRKLQIGIEKALEMGDQDFISPLTEDPSKFVKHIKDQCPKERPTYFNNYRSFKFWDPHIERIACMCSTIENEDLLLELMRILHNLTVNDMAPSLSWTSISQKYSILTIIKRCTVPAMNQIDLSMEAVILCNQICSHVEGSSLIAKPGVIRPIIQLLDDCDEDTEFMLQVLCLCETLLPFDDARKELLLETDLLQIIFDCLSDSNKEIRLSAERCLVQVENFDRDDSGGIGRFALMVKERRFIFHNSEWLNETTHG